VAHDHGVEPPVGRVGDADGRTVSGRDGLRVQRVYPGRVGGGLLLVALRKEVELTAGTGCRIASFRTGYLALLELRLEATRRPELRKVLTERVRADVDANVAYHEASGLPGDATAVKLLMLTLNWLIVEQLTLPDVFTEAEHEQLVTAAVERIVAAE
jgi:hypothetical protein